MYTKFVLSILGVFYLGPYTAWGQVSPYKLPFPSGTTFNCTQGNSQPPPASHNGIDSYAFDFGLPIGSLVCAMREGKVVDVEESYANSVCQYTTSCGGQCKDSNCNPCGNLVNRVVILHSDGHRSVYLHLNQNDVFVEVGDSVLQGQVIAKSGNSGCVHGLIGHLHVSVIGSSSCSVNNPWVCQTIPFYFCDFTSNNVVPQNSDNCTSGHCSACSSAINNSCFNPIPLNVNSSINYQPGTFCNSIISLPNNNLPNCILPSYLAQDVWYKFVPSQTTITIKMQSGADNDIIFQVLSNVSCATSYTDMNVCINNTGKGGMEETTLSNLVVGEVYFIRVIKNLSGIGGSALHRGEDFQICLWNGNTVNPSSINDTIIPVVVHVMHTGQPEGDQLNPSDSQIKAAIDYLNTVYKGTSFGASSGIGDIGIQFKLATLDPWGNCTSGITRTNLSGNIEYENYGIKDETNTSNIPSHGVNEAFIKSNQWNYKRYMNVWLVNNIESSDVISGFAYSPSNSAWQAYKDGVVIISNFLAMNYMTVTDLKQKNLLAHEVGHYLDLYHVFENSLTVCLALLPPPCNTSGDKVCDTPPVTPNDGAPRMGPNYCVGWTSNYSPNSENNIMSNTTARALFTSGQKQRMHNVFAAYDFRDSLIEGNSAFGAALSDLIVENQSVSPFQVQGGETIDLFFTERNIGPVNSGPNYISFHLSQDALLTPGANGDVFLGDYFINQSINTQSGSPVYTTSVQLPGNLTAGTYFVFFSANSTQTVTECNYENNFASSVISVVDTSEIAYYRYWFDEDVAGAIYSAQGVSGSELQSEISVSNLSEGVHTIHFQFKGNNDAWSSITSSTFYKGETILNLTGEFRYWFDEDFANVITTNTFTGGFLNLNTEIDLTNVNVGTHAIHFQFRPVGSTWSSISTLIFLKSSNSSAAISELQYWFDEEFSNAITVPTNSTNNLVLLQDVDLANLTNGPHTIHFKFKGGDLWSGITSHLFYKDYDGIDQISEMQYWFDDNYSGAVTQTLNPGSNLEFSQETDVLNLTPGWHIVNHRFKSSNGKWSSIKRDSINKLNNYLSFSIKLFLQGYYNTGEMEPVLFNQGVSNDVNISDSITVVLRSTSAPYSIVSNRKEKIAKNGIINTVAPYTTSQLNYIDIQQRNHIQTWSASPVLISHNMTYDFSNANLKAYASNQTQIAPGLFAFYSGDINQDGVIDGLDYNDWETDSNNFAGGYFSTDLNGDGVVDGLDFIYWEQNSNNFVGVVAP